MRSMIPVVTLVGGVVFGVLGLLALIVVRPDLLEQTFKAAPVAPAAAPAASRTAAAATPEIAPAGAAPSATPADGPAPPAAPAGGFAAGLGLPIDCTPGQDCWALRYVDHDPGPGVRDFACGPISGDGHKGTDFGIRDLAVMAAGVEVLAAAQGVVDALREGEPDVSVLDIGRAAVADKECGNGIRLDHGDGWTTWYCHLRRGSIVVREGDRVEAGQTLGLVGLSGDTSFPHVHFDVRQGDQPIDPYVGIDRGAAPASCGPGAAPLWRADLLPQLTYQPVLPTNAGFAVAPPERDDLRRGWHQRADLPVTSPALVLWVESFWVEAGDRIRFRVTGPAGDALVENDVRLDDDKQRWFGYAGAKRPGDRWPPGPYRGELTIERDGADAVTLERMVELR